MSHTGRRAQRPPKYRRSLEFPLDVPGAKDYVIRGIAPELGEKFDAKCAEAGNSKRFTILALMHAYVEGKISV